MKSNRQAKLLELIKNNAIITQEEIQSRLEKMGFKVTQSTVSRDIKELRIIKGHDINGVYRYIAAENSENSEQSVEHYRDLFARSVKSIDYSFNCVVIKCYNGMASSACVAADIMCGNKMLGSLAGEDTIFIVTKGEEQSKDLVAELKKLL